MTKKSQARLERDAAIKNLGPDAANWNTMKDLALTCRGAIEQTRANMIELFKTPGIAANVQEPAEVAIALRGLSSDLSSLSQELIAIVNTHEHLDGAVDSVESNTALLTTAARYEGWDVRFQTVVIPNVLYLTEQITAAGFKMHKEAEEAHKAAEAQALIDPNVVTDVQVKTPTSEANPSAVSQ